jgi:hypothetical protein
MPVLSLKLSKDVYNSLVRTANERGISVYQLVKDLVIDFAKGNTQQVCVQGVDIEKLSEALNLIDEALRWFSEIYDDIENIIKTVKEVHEDKLLNLNVVLTFAHNKLSDLKETISKQYTEDGKINQPH